jgi:hypothetical protein
MIIISLHACNNNNISCTTYAFEATTIACRVAIIAHGFATYWFVANAFDEAITYVLFVNSFKYVRINVNP